MTLALGYGYGDECGRGYVLKGYVRVDNIWCKVLSEKRNLAKVEIWPTQEIGYIAEFNGEQALGKTPREALEDAKKKWWALQDTEERLKMVRKQFREAPGHKLSGEELFEIHGILTGSCRFGRDNFVKTHQISLKKKYTLQEFVGITEKEYGGNIIKKLIRRTDNDSH